VTFQLFYVVTVFSQSWATSALHMPRSQCLEIQLFSVLFFALTIPLSGALADRWGGGRTMSAVTIGIGLFGLLFSTLFGSGDALQLALTLSIGMALMGATYGPLGSVLAGLFPTEIRYTGLSLSFNLAGILGASLAPYIALWLAHTYGLQYVGYYLTGGALLTLAALLVRGRTAPQAASLALPT